MMDLGDSGGNALLSTVEKKGTLESEIRIAEANRGERHLEVNYELAVRSRHSQRSLIF